MKVITEELQAKMATRLALRVEEVEQLAAERGHAASRGTLGAVVGTFDSVFPGELGQILDLAPREIEAYMADMAELRAAKASIEATRAEVRTAAASPAGSTAGRYLEERGRMLASRAELLDSVLAMVSEETRAVESGLSLYLESQELELKEGFVIDASTACATTLRDALSAHSLGTTDGKWGTARSALMSSSLTLAKQRTPSAARRQAAC